MYPNYFEYVGFDFLLISPFLIINFAKVYYFEELNCSKVDLDWDINRIVKNFQTLNVILYQELTTDIRGNPN